MRGVLLEARVGERGTPAPLADRERERDVTLRAGDAVAPVALAADDAQRPAMLALLHHQKLDAPGGAGRILVDVALAAGRLAERVPLRLCELDDSGIAI